ncbi:hypothetical protein BLA29_004522, partial [Euroglyphus maynei]
DSNHQSSSGLRRSSRKIQPKRRYSSDSADEQFQPQMKSRIRRSRSYQKHYDASVRLQDPRRTTRHVLISGTCPPQT